MSLPVHLDEHGAIAPPRENGELAFSAPWESRLFGLTMALVEAGRLDWEAFRGCLIARIGAWEREGGERHWNYWQRWREAFEESLDTAGLVDESEVDSLTRRLEARPHGHDHHDHHDHRDHDHHGYPDRHRDDRDPGRQDAARAAGEDEE